LHLQTEIKKVNSPALFPKAGVKIQTSKEMNIFNTKKYHSENIQKKKRYRYKTTPVELLNRFTWIIDAWIS